MFLFAVSLMIATSPQTHETPSKTLFCRHETQLSAKPRMNASVILEVDQAHEVIASTLNVWTPGFAAVWDVEPGKVDGGRTTRSFEVKPWALPRNTLFPITVSLVLDRQISSSHVFERSTTTLYDLVNDPPRPRSDPQWPLTVGSPAVTLPSTLRPDMLFGTKDAVLVVKDRKGLEVSRTTLQLPNWTKLSTLADEASVVLEQRRLGKECRPTMSIVVFD